MTRSGTSKRIVPADCLRARGRTPDEILSLLKLEPNATCGFVRLTFVSKQSLAAGVLPSPFAKARPIGSTLVTPDAVRLRRGIWRPFPVDRANAMRLLKA
jgi:hypothetical protein